MGQQLATNRAWKDFLRAFLLFLALCFWIGMCTWLFWAFLNRIPNGYEIESVRVLIWPFVTILIAMPVMAIAIMGGLKLLTEVLKLQELLTDLPKHATRIEQVVPKLVAPLSELSTHSSTLEAMASQLADMQSEITSMRARTNERAVEPAEVQRERRVEALSQHLTRATTIFKEAAERYENENGEGVRRVSGWILPESVDELYESKLLNKRQTEYIHAALEVDRRTRRTGRSNLRDEDIVELNSKADQLPRRTDA